MKRNGKCPKCGGTEIIADAKVIDRNESGEGELSVATFRKPDALIFKEKQASTVSAWICSACGYIEFYADDPAGIKLSKT
jgi:predicted nucleic-acid-binding Zn-ribbon protein